MNKKIQWFLRNEAGQLVSKNYVKPDPEREEVVFVSMERIRRILRPFVGLIHMKNFKDGLRISDKLGITKYIFTSIRYSSWSPGCRIKLTSSF